MMAMDVNVAVKLAQAARAKGYKVNMFGYGEGVTAVKKGQNPKRFPNVGKELEQAAKDGIAQAVCETCFAARGFERGEEIQGSEGRQPDQRPVQVRVRVGQARDHREVMMTWQVPHWC